MIDRRGTDLSVSRQVEEWIGCGTSRLAEQVPPQCPTRLIRRPHRVEKEKRGGGGLGGGARRTNHPLVTETFHPRGGGIDSGRRVRRFQPFLPYYHDVTPHDGGFLKVAMSAPEKRNGGRDRVHSAGPRPTTISSRSFGTQCSLSVRPLLTAPMPFFFLPLSRSSSQEVTSLSPPPPFSLRYYDGTCRPCISSSSLISYRQGNRASRPSPQWPERGARAAADGRLQDAGNWVAAAAAGPASADTRPSSQWGSFFFPVFFFFLSPLLSTVASTTWCTTYFVGLTG